MTEPQLLEKYLAYLEAVPEQFSRFQLTRPDDRPIAGITGVQAVARMINALMDARRLARAQAGLTEAEVESAAELIDWARKHSAEIDAAERRAEAPFVSRG